MSSERILYQDPHCLVINKLAGEAAEGAPESDAKTSIRDLKKAVVQELTSLEGVSPATTHLEAAHRLDVPVTGAVLFARHQDSLAYYNSIFAQNKANRTYWAIIEKPAKAIPARQQLEHYLLFNQGQNKSKAYHEDGPGRKKAVLSYRVVGEGDRYLFLEIELESGRHHQIRAQLAAEKLHIKGDLKYGARRSEKNGGIRLHCQRLEFPDYNNPDKLIKVLAPVLVPDALWLAFAQCAG